jgi:hypothetical protein
MADGLGNAVGGLLGVAILANVAGNMMRGPQKTRTKVVYRNRPVKKRRKPNHFGI